MVTLERKIFSRGVLTPQQMLDLNRTNYRRMQKEAQGNEDRQRVLNLAMESCERELTERGAR